MSINPHDANRSIRRVTQRFGNLEAMWACQAEYAALAEQSDTPPQVAEKLRECVVNIDRYAAEYQAARSA